MKQKDEKREVTVEDAKKLLVENGQTPPSIDLVGITHLILKTCVENEVELTDLNKPLYPALEWDDIELFMSIEQDLDIEIDVDDAAWSKMETFADLVCCVEARVVFLRNRLANEKAKIASARCSTQAAFYALRRRLSDTGAGFHKVHGLRPSLPLIEIPAKHAEPLAELLAKEYGLPLPLQRVLWNRADTWALQWAFFFASVAACFFAAPYLPLPFLSGALLCLLTNISFARLVGRYARFKWPKEYRTLGDVARKIAAAATQAAS